MTSSPCIAGILVACGIVAASHAVAAPGEPYAIPAHWLASDEPLKPRVGDFSFDGLSFASADDGVIVGDRFLLRVKGDDLTLTFVNDNHTRLSSVALEGPEDGWATGGRSEYPADPENVVWRYQRGRWSSTTLAAKSAHEWQIARIRVVPGFDPFLLGFRMSGHQMLPRFARLAATGPQFESLPVDDEIWTIVDVCSGMERMPLAVGWKQSGPQSARRPLAVGLSDRGWQDLSPSCEGGIGDDYFNMASCWPGGVIAAGLSAASGAGGTSEPLLMRYDGSWSKIPWPENARHKHPIAVSAQSGDDVWIAAACVGPVADCSATTFHFQVMKWEEAPLPQLPGDRGKEYVLKAMKFPSTDTGWAIANDVVGAELNRGLIFHYSNGKWTNRNWDWHVWDEPWFGVFRR